MNTPDKCPKCGENVAERLHRGAAVYKCATRYFPARGRMVEHWQQSASCGLSQRDQLLARVKRLEEALVSIQEYWNRDENERAMSDACWHAINTAAEALEAKEAQP